MESDSSLFIGSLNYARSVVTVEVSVIEISFCEMKDKFDMEVYAKHG